MIKTRFISLAVLLSLLCALMFSIFTPLQSSAVFDENFDVTWNTDGNNQLNVSGASEDMNSSFAKIIEKYKTVITFLSGIGAVSMVAFFIILFMKLGGTVGNPQERSKVITGLIITGVAAAGLGSVSLIVGIFYGMLGE